MYRQKQNPQYESFRQSWMQGYKNALTVKRQLQGQGWVVERGALTQNQVKGMRNELEKSGYEMQTIPVAEWNGEQVHLVAYKLKSGAAPPQPKPKTRRTTTKDPTEEFLKIFWRGQKNKEEPDDGVLMDPRRVAAVVPKNASPQQSRNLTLVKVVEEGIQQAEQVRPLDYGKLLKIQKIGKTQKQPVKYVSFGGEWVYDIEYVKKAMRVLGTKTEAEAYRRKDQPLVVRHKQTGHSIVNSAFLRRS